MYNILRVNENKFKTKGHITQALNHNMRIYIDEHLRERIYPEKSNHNKLVFNPLGFDAMNGGSDFQEKLFKHYDDLGIKAKSDNVLMLEFIISASPEFFEAVTPQVVAAWEKSQLEFLKEQFGDNLKLVVEHNDESTKHYHAFVSTEIKSVKKYKNQKGEFFKETWSLNAKRFDPEFLVRLHDAHAVKNDGFGLLRGVEGSTATHESLKDYTKRLKRVLSRNYGEIIAGKLDQFFAAKSNMLGYIASDKAKKVLVPFLSELKSDLDCLKFHIKDKAKRNKLLEEEAKRLKFKEKQMDQALEDATQALRSKNLKIDDLIAENKVLKQSEVDLTEMNKNLSADLVNYQNQIKILKKKLGFK